jgi:hypothetical protein
MVKRLKYALKLFWMALTKPYVFQYAVLGILEQMFKFLKETAEADRPMKCELEIRGISKIAEVAWGNDTVLHIWCGVPSVDNPLKRINQLVAENDELKRKLNYALNDKRSVANPPNSSNDPDKQSPQ